MSEKIYMGLVGVAIFFVGLVAGIVITPQEGIGLESVQQVDYSERFDNIESRFDRVETGIQNSVRDICFQWGGQWVADQNNLVTQDFDIPLDNGLFAKGQAIMCVRQSQGVNQ